MTQNATLDKCFQGRFVDTIPSEPVSFVVFAVLTDGQGAMTVQVVLQRPDNLDEIYAAAEQVFLPDQVHEAWCQFPINEVVFPIQGAYQVCLLIDGEPIGQRRLNVRLRRNQP